MPRPKVTPDQGGTEVRSTSLWRAYAHVYDRLWDTPLTERLGDRIADLVPPGQAVVEVGAGTGLVTVRLLARGLVVEVSEPDPSMAARLRRRLPDHDVRSEPLDQLVSTQPRPVTVVAANVLHLLADPDGALATLRALAGPEGRVVVATPIAESTIRAAAAAHRHAGAGWWHTVTFVAGHLALAPWSARTAAARRRGFRWHPDAIEVDRIGVCRILAVDGREPSSRGPLPVAAGAHDRARR